MDLVKLMEGKSTSRSSIIAAVKARAAAAKLTLQYLEREKEEMLELSRLKCEQEAEEAKALCKAQMETYGISHPVDLPVISCENSYPAGHFDSIPSGPGCEGSIPVSPDISCDSAISSSCLSKPVSQTPVVHDSFSVPPIFFKGQGNQFHSHCNSFETVSNFGDFHSNSNGNFSVNPMSSHDVQDHPISQLNLVYSENFGPISSTHVSRNYPPRNSHFVTPSSGPSADASTRPFRFVCSAQNSASVYDNSAFNQNQSYITSPNLTSDVFCNPALTVHPGYSPSPVIVHEMSDPRLSEFVVPGENDDDIACDIANNCKQELLDSQSCNVFSHTIDTSRRNFSIELSSRPSCFLCSQSHLLDCCPDFLKMSVENRFSFAFQNRLCYSCLQSNHLTKFCPKRSICSICQHSHPTSLHRGKPRNNTEQPKKLIVQPVTVETDCREVDVPDKLPAFDPVVEISCLDSESSDDDKCGITVPVSVSSELSTKYEKSVYCLLDRSFDPSFISGVYTDTESLSESSVVHRTIVKQTQPPVIDMEKGEYLETPLLFSDREESEILKCDSPIDIVDCDQHGYMEKPLIRNHLEKVAISCPFDQLTSTSEVHVPFQSDMTFTCMTFDDPLTLCNFEVELTLTLFCFLWYLVQHRKRTKAGIIYK